MPNKKQHKADKEKRLPTISKRSAKLPSGLTIKQETFCQLVAKGYNYAEAYRTAYDVTDGKSGSTYISASRTARLPHIQQRIETLQNEMLEEHSTQAPTRAIRVVATLETLMKGAKRDADKLKAAELLGKTVALFDPNNGDALAREASLTELEKRLADLMAHSK